VQASQAQYRYDGVTFTTVYWDRLCDALKQNPGYLLLDVRSKGEFEDTSSFKNLNIGHLAGATNIDINELRGRLNEIEAYKAKPVFVYCSHSQRSRRVSKMLADSGFTNVLNINGGVSNLRLYDFGNACGLLTTRLPYQILSPIALAKSKGDDYFILDLRADSAFRGMAIVEKRNGYGRIKNAVNIPLLDLQQKLSSLPRDKKILLVDENGNDSPVAAQTLTKNGFNNVSVLFNGMEAYLTEVPTKERTNWTASAPYRAIGAEEFDHLAKEGNSLLVDVRTNDEFNNQAKESFRNIGNIKGAINISFGDWDKQFAALPADKEKPVVVYALSNQPEVFEAAKRLSARGYKNVNVLLGGLFSLRWRAANIKGQEHLKDWVVNVPSDNL
jgi:rhodanese-related sulfurtransferase